ncbi:hypothetical protein FRC00_000956, partial [Tulasnella sp. 408]
MFGKLLSRRTPAITCSSAPQFQLGPNPQSVSKKPSKLVKKLLSVKNVFRSSSSSKRGRPAVAQNDWTGRDYLHSTVESTRSHELLNVPSYFQAGRPSSTSAGAPHATSSAHNSQPLAPPQFVATIPATSRAPIHSTSQCSTRSAASRSIVSSKTSSPVALPPAVATTPATTFLPTRDRSSFHPSTNLASGRSASSINRFPLFAPHHSAALSSATTFSPAGSAPRRSTRSAARHPKWPDNASLLLAIPQSIATTPATAASPVFSSIRCPKPTRNLLHAREIIANLEKIAAATDIQYNNCVPTVHSAIPDEVDPCTKSVVDESGSAKRRLENLKRRIVAVEGGCAQLEEQLYEECEKVDEAEVALKKAGRNLKETDRECAKLQAVLYGMQLGRFVDCSWYQRGSEPKIPQRADQAVESWDSHWDSQIALARYALPRAVQAVQSVASSEPEDTRSESKGRQ